jgi:predicted NAD/FAD-binding protein
MPRRRIAVIGGGISGLTAGYVLSRTAQVTLFEAEGRLGGHADTHLVTPEIAVDTGFIVYNERTYPLLTRLFGELGVTTQPSEMSMSVSCDGCGLSYAGKRGLSGLAAGLGWGGAGLGRGGARYLGMLAAVPRFHRAARRFLAAGRPDDITLGEFLSRAGYPDYFTAHFAVPLVAAVWSCPPGAALDYPARYLFAFLANHGMLSVSGSPRWRTVTGGSRRYVERAAARITAVRVAAPVRSVHRYPDGVLVRDVADQAADFDAVVIATHPDQALRLLADPTRAERQVLGAFSYTDNPAALHSDTRALPARRAARASWNYRLADCRAAAGARVSYHMNRLQSLPSGRDYIVTLGGPDGIDPDQVISKLHYAHPAYTPESVAAQRRLPELNTAVTAFAGAYHGWGFHEDGCRSGAEAAHSLGGSW